MVISVSYNRGNLTIETIATAGPTEKLRFLWGALTNICYFMCANLACFHDDDHCMTTNRDVCSAQMQLLYLQLVKNLLLLFKLITFEKLTYSLHDSYK